MTVQTPAGPALTPYGGYDFDRKDLFDFSAGAKVKLYKTLVFTLSFLKALNPNSLEILKDCKIEPSLATARPGDRVQFERQGYFCVDAQLSRPGALVFNRIVGLKDAWSRIEKRGA